MMWLRTLRSGVDRVRPVDEDVLHEHTGRESGERPSGERLTARLHDADDANDEREGDEKESQKVHAMTVPDNDGGKTMGTYRKRPIEVEAHQWDGEHFGAVREFLQYEDEHQFLVQTECTVVNGVLSFFCMKSDAFVMVQPNGWVIAEPDGHGFYPCTEADFAASYDEVL